VEIFASSNFVVGQFFFQLFVLLLPSYLNFFAFNFFGFIERHRQCAQAAQGEHSKANHTKRETDLCPEQH
jgi:hypothetical protein